MNPMNSSASNRPLAEAEARTLAALLALDFLGADALRCQMDSARVVGQCPCGCATVYLEVDRKACPRSPASRPLPAEANVMDDDGNPIGGVIIFTQAGYLSSLELYSYDAPIKAFPPLDHLQLYVRDR